VARQAYRPGRLPDVKSLDPSGTMRQANGQDSDGWPTYAEIRGVALEMRPANRVAGFYR
jgi:hypothetical protein